MAARKAKQPASEPNPDPPAAITTPPADAKTSAYNRKVLAAAVLIVGVIIAIAVSKFQLGSQTSGENEPGDPATTSVLGESGAIDEIPQDELPRAESPPEDDAVAMTEADKFSQMRSKEPVESLPPAPGAKTSNVSKKQMPVRGPPETGVQPPKQQSQPETKKPQPETKKPAPKAAPKNTDTKKVDTKQADAKKGAPKQESNAPQLGKLVEIGKDTYRSTAGLIYGPGSAEGHRVKHVMNHAVDDPQRPIHGVFDGKQDQILAVIDEAWLIAKKGGKGFSVEYDGNRAIYLVDMGRRIGYVGGKTGKRQNHPGARHLRLVLERQNVITAFPDRP